MQMNRRDFVKQAAVASAVAPGLVREQAAKPASAPLPLKIGMTDWNLGKRGDITKIALAREIGLDGIQVSLQFPTDGSPHLRDPKTQAEFKQAALENGIQICSLAIGIAGKVAAAAAHESGRGDSARRGGRGGAQSRHEQHPAADPRRQPHQHGRTSRRSTPSSR